jgi:hypothetical protein
MGQGAQVNLCVPGIPLYKVPTQPRRCKIHSLGRSHTCPMLSYSRNMPVFAVRQHMISVLRCTAHFCPAPMHGCSLAGPKQHLQHSAGAHLNQEAAAVASQASSKEAPAAAVGAAISHNGRAQTRQQQQWQQLGVLRRACNCSIFLLVRPPCQGAT